MGEHAADGRGHTSLELKHRRWEEGWKHLESDAVENEEIRY
jgi:hypothetical protein